MDGFLKAENLGKRYGKVKVVNDVCIGIRRGEVVGLLGPNGAGKTTTFYMIVGILRPDEGKISLGDRDITALPMHERARLGIGYLSQESSIFRRLTVRENILAILETLPISKGEIGRRLDSLMGELDIRGIADRKAFNLSGGERRRVEITRALATEPSYILLDEPFVGIDPIAVAEIQEIVLRLKKKGLGVLITDHSVRETLTTTDRAYIMFEGEIVVSGTADELTRDEKARKFYLGEKFRL
ncbi:MAG: LPS export ABC transporter ATP-binding protein [Candidatus Eisenbacteria bacterium]|nr:LPS export ABC transporter ATP-binding protein [Candidatus Eisenbacteria bacterium]